MRHHPRAPRAYGRARPTAPRRGRPSGGLDRDGDGVACE
ncbi:excalibur calcium-binding domain-containing protein [Streptomyces sp. NPDC088354]